MPLFDRIVYGVALAYALAGTVAFAALGLARLLGS